MYHRMKIYRKCTFYTYMYYIFSPMNSIVQLNITGVFLIRIIVSKSYSPLIVLTFCLSPVRWASSTISFPNCEKQLTKSVNVVTEYSSFRVLDTYSKELKTNLEIIHIGTVTITTLKIFKSIKSLIWLIVECALVPWSLVSWHWFYQLKCGT